jgi:hypothetical protein
VTPLRRVEIVTLPARSPNLNAYTERWVRTIHQECLRRSSDVGPVERLERLGGMLNLPYRQAA